MRFDILLTIIVGIILTLGIMYTSVWWSEHDSSRPSISFNAFISFYSITPDKWYISCSDYVLYYRNPADSSGERVYMTTPVDSLRLFFFDRMDERDKSKKKRLKRTEEFLKLWQEDIESFSGQFDDIMEELNEVSHN